MRRAKERHSNVFTHRILKSLREISERLVTLQLSEAHLIFHGCFMTKTEEKMAKKKQMEKSPW